RLRWARYSAGLIGSPLRFGGNHSGRWGRRVPPSGSRRGAKYCRNNANQQVRSITFHKQGLKSQNLPLAAGKVANRRISLKVEDSQYFPAWGERSQVQLA